MNPLLLIISIAASLVSLVCWILILVKLFQTDTVVNGIVSIICPLIAFIYGWSKRDQLNSQKIMPIWTVAVIVNIVMNIVVAASGQR